MRPKSPGNDIFPGVLMDKNWSGCESSRLEQAFSIKPGRGQQEIRLILFLLSFVSVHGVVGAWIVIFLYL